MTPEPRHVDWLIGLAWLFVGFVAIAFLLGLGAFGIWLIDTSVPIIINFVRINWKILAISTIIAFAIIQLYAWIVRR